MLLKKLKIGEKMFLGFGFVMLLMLLVIGNSYINFSKQGKSVDTNLHTYEVISETDKILISLINMETGIRGYVITGDESFLDPYNQGKLDYDNYYSKIKELTFENSRHQKLLQDVDNSYSTWLQWQTSEIIAGREKVASGQMTMDDLIAIAQTKKGKTEMDKIRTALNAISEEEANLLEKRNAQRLKMEKQTQAIMISGGGIATFLAFLVAYFVIRIIVNPVRIVTKTFKEISEGNIDLEVRLPVNSYDELGHMSKYFNRFMEKLEEQVTENENENWIKTGKAELSEEIRNNENINSLCNNALNFIAYYVKAQIGAIYINTGNNSFKMISTYAHKENDLTHEFKLGEGMIGQSALEKRSISIFNVPSDYIKITSGLGVATPKTINITPCIYNEEVQCVIELGSFGEFSDVELSFIKQASESIAVSISLGKTQEKMRELLSKTLIQSEELQAQQEELKQNNEELEEQTRALRKSEVALQSQQEELRVINEELEEKTKNLELQKNDILLQNERLNSAQIEIEEKAKELEASNRYKSEFLANMSHELRTPLNSILVLSQILSNKKDSTDFTQKEIQYAKTINSSGKDLLKLINDVLDISKVEAGKMDVSFEKVYLSEFSTNIRNAFEPIALEKGLTFKIEIEEDMPEFIVSDGQRLGQIVNNLLSNSFKFTHEGEIKLIFSRLNLKEVSKIKGNKNNFVSIRVQDTGIGVPIDKQKLIFEAFKQSDGTISRKYGGTGLGLSISRELVNLLGGDIYLESYEGKGSIFTLIIPEKNSQEKSLEEGKESFEDISSVIIKEKLENYDEEQQEITNISEKLVLIIEDDKKFLNLLCDLADEKGYKSLLASNGRDGINLAMEYRPSAIILDIGLPDISGWKVIDMLKENESTKDIPIHIISGREEDFNPNYFQGIIGYLKKPVSLGELYNVFRKVDSNVFESFNTLLLVGEEIQEDDLLIESLRKKGGDITVLHSGIDAYNMLKSKEFHCMILDLKLKDMNSLELLSRLEEEKLLNLPILIHTEENITEEEEEKLKRYTKSIILKGEHSLERLVDEASLFLHDVDSKIDKDKIKSIKISYEKENSLNKKKVLIVDDDMRNVFALTSILEEKGIKVVVGRNGEEGIEKLQENPDIVLMDVMMPKMDGLTAIRVIRNNEKYSKIPIIAITAKAMKEDREKCIEAGANDYLTKPIDTDKLISLLRVWLYK